MSVASKKAMVLLLLLIAILPFQNCSNVNFKARPHATQKTGGEGFDGKLYSSQGPCGQEIGVADSIVVSRDLTTAKKTRSGCTDLVEPVPIALAELSYSGPKHEALRWRDRIFDLSTGGADQRTSIAVCDTTGVSPAVRAWLWSSGGSTYGNLAADGRAPTSDLNVIPPGIAAPFNYVTVAGQPDMFDLSLGANMTYSLYGGPQQVAGSVTCTTQPPLIRVLQKLGQKMTGGGDQFEMATSPIGGGNLLVLGLSIFPAMQSQCILGLYDNVGNVYQSAGALAADSASGSSDIWYSSSSKAGGSKITINLDPNCGIRSVAGYFLEVSGMAKNQPLDTPPGILNSQTASQTVVGASASSKVPYGLAFNVTVAENSLLRMAADSSMTPLPVTIGDGAAFEVLTSIKSLTPTWEQDVAGTSCSSTAIFRAAW